VKINQKVDARLSCQPISENVTHTERRVEKQGDEGIGIMRILLICKAGYLVGYVNS